MSRRYAPSEVYDDRHSEYSRAPPRRATRDYTELDIDIQRGQHDLDFLDDDYGRSRTAGPLVIRERPRESLPPNRAPRSVEHDDVVVEQHHHDEGRRRCRVDKEEIDVIVRRDEGSVRSAGSRRTAAPYRERTRDVERDEVVVDHREVRRGGRVVEHQDDILIRSDDRARGGRRDDRETVQIRHRSKDRGRYDRVPSPPSRGQSRTREKEEIIIERRRARSRSRSLSSSRSPPRRRSTKDTEQIIIRRTEQREPSPPPRIPTPEPEPLPPIIRAPIHQQIHQEVITHHRHIDHGVQRAYSPSPPPPPPRIATPPRKVEETIEIDIKRRGRHDEEDEVIVEHDHRSRRDHETALALRPRSHSPARRRRGGYDDDLQEEADYYNRKAMERAYIGEAHDGATRDWNIVDVPPGTERVRMDGAGGSSQEITWQRYNGVRRSKFMAGGREYDSGYGYEHERIPEPPLALPPIQPTPTKMWTEITKDLVLRDAIDAFGYDYEETEFFFYVMEYLRYEEVLQLVELSDDMRQDRRRRIREIEWEREQLRRERKHRTRAGDGERYYEHEVIVDTRRRR